MCTHNASLLLCTVTVSIASHNVVLSTGNCNSVFVLSHDMLFINHALPLDLQSCRVVLQSVHMCGTRPVARLIVIQFICVPLGLLSFFSAAVCHSASASVQSSAAVCHSASSSIQSIILPCSCVPLGLFPVFSAGSATGNDQTVQVLPRYECDIFAPKRGTVEACAL